MLSDRGDPRRPSVLGSQRAAARCAKGGVVAPEHAKAHAARVSKTIQIRDVDDRVYAALVRRAAEVGVSVPELLRAEAERLASRPSVATWLERTRGRAGAVDRAEILAALDDQRGTWPDAGR